MCLCPLFYCYNPYTPRIQVIAAWVFDPSSALARMVVKLSPSAAPARAASNATVSVSGSTRGASVLFQSNSVGLSFIAGSVHRWWNAVADAAS